MSEEVTSHLIVTKSDARAHVTNAEFLLFYVIHKTKINFCHNELSEKKNIKKNGNIRSSASKNKLSSLTSFNIFPCCQIDVNQFFKSVSSTTILKCWR
jgi:hypothetical protein